MKNSLFKNIMLICIFGHGLHSMALNAAPYSNQTGQSPLIVAHRGGKILNPENTIKAFDACMKEYEVDGYDGVLETIENDSNNPLSALGLIESNDPLYVLGWCLDQKDGEGSVVCVIGSDLPWETTKEIFDSISSDLA